MKRPAVPMNVPARYIALCTNLFDLTTMIVDMIVSTEIPRNTMSIIVSPLCRIIIYPDHTRGSHGCNPQVHNSLSFSWHSWGIHPHKGRRKAHPDIDLRIPF